MLHGAPRRSWQVVILSPISSECWIKSHLVICRPGLWAGSRLKPAVQSRAEPEPSRRLTAAYGSGFEFGKPFAQAQAQAWVLLGRLPWLRLQAAGRRSHHRSERSLTPSQQDSHSAQRQNDTFSPCGNCEHVGFGPLPTPRPHPKRERICHRLHGRPLGATGRG